MDIELDNCREDYDELAKEYDQLRAELDAVKNQLETITPGGSEFHNSPFNCMDWIKSRMSSAGKVATERNQLRAELDAARANNKRITQYCDAIKRKVEKQQYSTISEMVNQILGKLGN